MAFNEPLDLAQLSPVESVVGGQCDRIEPEFGLIPAGFDVDVRRLLTLVSCRKRIGIARPASRLASTCASVRSDFRPGMTFSQSITRPTTIEKTHGPNFGFDVQVGVLFSVRVARVRNSDPVWLGSIPRRRGCGSILHGVGAPAPCYPAPFPSSILYWWVATSGGLLQPDGDDQRPVHRQGGGRRPARRAKGHHKRTLPAEVLTPSLSPRVIQRHILPRVGVGGRLIGPLPQRARNARQREVARLGWPPRRPRDDMIDVECRLLAEL